jgi:hypothetical protein
VTASDAYTELGPAGPFTLYVRCRDAGGGAVDAFLGEAGPTGRVDLTTVSHTSGGPAATPDTSSDQIAAVTASTPLPLAQPSAPSAERSTTSADVLLASGAGSVHIDAWAQARATGAAPGPGCHFSASVTPLQ